MKLCSLKGPTLRSLVQPLLAKDRENSGSCATGQHFKGGLPLSPGRFIEFPTLIDYFYTKPQQC